MADTTLDPANVPPALHSLIPYAEKWGIRDEKRRAAMLRETPLSEIEELCEVMNAAWDDINEFTIHDPLPRKIGSNEFEVFDAFRAVYGEVFEILTNTNPKRVLEIIGFPEAWTAMKFDHNQVPPELQALILYAEKWVIDDEGVRMVVLKAATDAEFEELLAAINQIGEARIREIMYKMLDTETQRMGGYVFSLLLDVADEAKHRLSSRKP